nr:histone-lysine N-methyltransferase 2C-like isoform X2 [Tanacetum cinerariifolium]
MLASSHYWNVSKQTTRIVSYPGEYIGHKGTVHEVFEGTSVVSVTLDDGKTSNVDLDKQGIRFYSQKRRW